jgi:hypothetical protein
MRVGATSLDWLSLDVVARAAFADGSSMQRSWYLASCLMAPDVCSVLCNLVVRCVDLLVVDLLVDLLTCWLLTCWLTCWLSVALTCWLSIEERGQYCSYSMHWWPCVFCQQAARCEGCCRWPVNSAVSTHSSPLLLSLRRCEGHCKWAVMCSSRPTSSGPQQQPNQQHRSSSTSSCTCTASGWTCCSAASSAGRQSCNRR